MKRNLKLLLAKLIYFALLMQPEFRENKILLIYPVQCTSLGFVIASNKCIRSNAFFNSMHSFFRPRYFTDKYVYRNTEMVIVTTTVL